MKTKIEKRSCNECGSQMISVALDREALIQSDACATLACPNYGLLQVPAEVLKAYFKGLRKR